MSLDVSKILIKVGTLSRLFELFGCTMLDSVSVVVNSLAECTFLRRFQCFYEGLGPWGATVTLRHSLLSVGCLNIPKCPQASVGVWETCWGHWVHPGENFNQSKTPWRYFGGQIPSFSVKWHQPNTKYLHNITGLRDWDIPLRCLEL